MTTDLREHIIIGPIPNSIIHTISLVSAFTHFISIHDT